LGIIELIVPLLDHKIKSICSNVIGILKHLTNLNTEVQTSKNALYIVNSNGFIKLLKLHESSADTAVKNESIRTLIYMIRHGWSTDDEGRSFIHSYLL
jgi:hypothetical protein